MPHDSHSEFIPQYSLRGDKKLDYLISSFYFVQHCNLKNSSGSESLLSYSLPFHLLRIFHSILVGISILFTSKVKFIDSD